MARSFIGKGLRAAGIAAVVVLLLLLVLRLAVPVLGVRIANSQLSDLLGAEVRIGEIELALFRGSLALKDLRVRQPEGFGEGELLHVPEVRARVKLGSLLHFPVRVEEVLLVDPKIWIVRGREGDLDLDAVISAVLSPPDGIDADEKPEPQEEEEPLGFPVVIEEGAVRNLWVSYTDYSNQETPYEAKLESLTFVVTNLSLESFPGGDGPSTRVGGSERKGVGTNRGSLTLKNLRIDQPAGFRGDALLTIPELNLKAHVPSVFKPRLTLEEVSIKDVAIRLARNDSGRLNLEALLSEAVPHGSGASRAEEEVSSEKDESESPPDWKVLLKRFEIDGLSFLYTDHSFQDEPLTMRVPELSLEVTDLVLASGEADAFRRGEMAQQEGDAKHGGGAKGSLVLRDVHVDQPHGFSGDTLLSWPELKVDFVVDSVFDPSIVIESADLNEPRIDLAFDKAGQGNVTVLLSKVFPGPKDASEGPQRTPVAGPSDPKTRIHVSKFAIHDLGLVFTDSSYPEKPMEVRLEGVDLEATNFTYEPSRPRERSLPATLRVTGHQIQTPFANAPLGLYAKIGALEDEVPAVNGSLQLAGLELAPMSHTLPQGTIQAIGGDAMDLSVDLSLAADVLDCNAKVKSIGGSNLSLRIGGTPEKPELDTSNMLFLVFFRSGGALGSVAGRVGGAGVGVADTAVGTVKAVGTGTVKTLGSVGGGVFQTAKGLATADVGGLAKGLEKTTIGTVKEGVGTAAGTVGEVKEGAVDVGSAGIGKKQAEAWRKATENRWKKAWKEAQERVNRMPYPTSDP